jgi:hypothetical protein
MFSPYSKDFTHDFLTENMYQTHTCSKYFSINNRICPKCLKSNQYIKKYWDIFFVTSCIEHNCLLIEECPNCKKKIKYNRSSIYRCKCGFDFREVKDLVYINNENAHDVTKLVLKLCGFSSASISFSLSNISFEELVETFLLLVRQVFKKRYITSPRLDIKTLHEYMNETYKIFENWPNNLYQKLDEYEQSAKKFGIRSFGSLYEITFGSKYTNLKLDIFRHAFTTYIQTEWTNGNAFQLDNVYLEKENLEFVNLSRAADILGKSEETIKELLEKGKLNGKIKQGAKVSYYIISMESIKNFISNDIDMKEKTILQAEVGKILDIQHTVIKKLREEKMLTACNSPKFGSNEGYRYKIKEVMCFFDSLERNLDYHDISIGDLISFSDARKLVNCSFVNFVRYLEKNTIPVYKIQESTKLRINNYFFKKQDILNKVLKEINGYSREDLRKIFDVSRDIINGWIEFGFLLYDLNKSRKVIKYEYIEQFKRNYIVLESIDLKKEFKSQKLIAEYLESKGVFPVNNNCRELYLVDELKRKFKGEFKW